MRYINPQDDMFYKKLKSFHKVDIPYETMEELESDYQEFSHLIGIIDAQTNQETNYVSGEILPEGCEYAYTKDLYYDMLAQCRYRLTKCKNIIWREIVTRKQHLYQSYNNKAMDHGGAYTDVMPLDVILNILDTRHGELKGVSL